jgi:hypothetical protein
MIDRDKSRILITVGSIIALIGYIMSLINGLSGKNPGENLIGPIVGIIISVLILIALNLIPTKKVKIPLNAWVMIVFLALQFFLSGEAIFSLVGAGFILEVIGTVILFLLEN